MPANSLLSTLHRVAGVPRFPGLEEVELAFGEVLHRSGRRIRHVYFPTDSLISLVSDASGDIAVEIGVIGRDGMLGVGVALGDERSPARGLVQAGGAALRATSADFMRAFALRRGMRRDVRRYSNQLAVQVMRTAACNRNHGAEQRLARWLLMMRDRLSGDRYRLTQKYLGFMLGVRRATINEAAAQLLRRGLIDYSRGSVRVLDRAGLKAASCACYLPWRDSRGAAGPG